MQERPFSVLRFFRTQALFTGLCFLCLAGAVKLSAQTTLPAYAQRSRWLNEKLQDMHYAPPAIDDSFSQALFDAFLDQLDPYRMYLLESEVAQLRTFADSLDEMVLKGQYPFLTTARSIFVQAVNRVDTATRALLAEPFDYLSADQGRVPDGENETFATTDAGRTEYWRVFLKSRILSNMFESGLDSTGYEPAMAPRFLEGEALSRARIQKQMDRRIHRRLKDPDQWVGEAFLNAICDVYDPHTSYFSPVDQQVFSSMLSSQNYSVGITVTENANGEVTIARLVPGGPAWKSGSLHEGDLLLSLQSGTLPAEDATLMSDYEVNEWMEKARGSVTLTVRKKTCQTATVTLAKAKVRSEENLVRSLMLEGDHRVAYLSLPGFYTNEEGDSRLGCANDIARELAKLLKENVEGVILDLRFNGGGSVKEAADICGLFIDAGPLWIRRTKEDQRTTAKDMNRGAMYTGPLLIMVNGASASASEFVAGTLQDHQRAVIVGTPTYGKASSQIVVPLSPFANSESGYVKVTTDRYYHLPGGTHQIVGIEPDILIPDPFDRWMSREKDYPNAFPYDTIVKKVYYEPQPVKGLQGAVAASKARVAAHAGLKELEKLCSQMDAMRDFSQKISLRAEDYFQRMWNYHQLADQVEALTKGTPGSFAVRSNKFDEELLQLDEFSREIQNETAEKIRNDIYINECVQILNDLIQP